MTTSDNISAIEAVEKAMEGVTPGDWIAYELPGVASTVPVPIAFICGPIRVIRGRSEGFSPADAAYIAACNPVAMPAILAEARKAEAMKREIAEKDARIAALENGLEFVALWAWREDPPNANTKLTDAERISVIKHHPTVKSVYETGARALLSKESADDQG